MSAMMEMMRMQAMTAMQGVITARWGVISAYDPDTYAIKAQIQPEGTETGWLPLLSQWVGPNWGDFSGPLLGMQIQLIFEHGNMQSPVGAGQAWSTQAPPIPVPSGERLIQHASGSLLHFDNAGNVTLTANKAMTMNAPSGLTINAGTQINGNVQTSGTILAAKDISDNGGSYGTVNSIRQWGDGHTHPVPDGTSGAPNQQMAD
jgi:uncharacterized protein involved in type VI secretion and phage assembly